MLPLAVIYLLSCLCVCSQVPALGFLFGVSKGNLWPNNPKVCTSDNITLTCTLNNASYNSADLRFSINDSPVPENRTVIVDATSRALTLTNITMDDYNANILCCSASCKQPDNIVEGQLLEVYDYPVPVEDFSCIRHGWENRMNCTWSLAHNYKRFPDVTVHWRIPSLSASWTCCPELVGHEKCNWDMGSIGDREIQVHVNVTSQCGINVGNLFEVNTGNIVKPEPIPEMEAKAMNSSCIIVNWSYKMSAEHWKQYKIELQSKWNDPIQPYYRSNTNATVFEQAFYDLVPNTEYTIVGQVKPMTRGFWSEVKDAKTTTPKAEPYGSPEVTRGGYMWDPSEKQCDTNGRRTVYIYYKSIPEQHENGVMKEITATSDRSFYHYTTPINRTSVPAHHTQISVYVDCDQDYSFELTAVNEIGPGKQRSTFNIPRVTHGIVMPETIVETSGDLVYLNWSVGVGNEPTGFTVFWCEKDSGSRNCNNTVPVQWKTVGRDRNTATLPVSKPDDFYYSVSMETDQGSTGMLWEKCLYVINAEPKQKTDPPTVSRTPNDNTLSVYWNRIACGAGSPYFPLYKVVYCQWNADRKNCTASSEEVVVPASQSSVILEGLKEDVEYGVMVQGVTADGQVGPPSEASFGVPENNSLKPAEIVGIILGGLTGFVFIIAGAMAAIRYCNQKRKKLLKGPEIHDILSKTDNKKSNPNGYINRNYSEGSLSQIVLPDSQSCKQANGYITQNDLQKDILEKTTRQLSVDSGCPEDPMTPRLGDAVSFPETIEEMASQQSLERPVSPDETKSAPAWPKLPTGYIRVNTEEDNIPRVATCPDINDKSKETRHDSFKPPVTNYLDLALGVVPPTELVIFTAQTNRRHEKPRDDSKADNTDKIDERIKKSVVTEPVSSYSKIHSTDEGNGIVKKAGSFAPLSAVNTQTTTDSNSSENDYAPHPVANTQTTPSNLSANGHGHPVANTQITIVSNSIVNGYVPHPSTNTQPTPANSSVNGYVPHPSANTQHTPGNSSVTGYVPHSVANTQPTPVTNTITKGYVPHPPANTQTTPVNSSADGYVPHPSANAQPTPVANPSANGYVLHPPASTQTTLVTNTSANGYVPHPPANSQPTPVNTSANGYVPLPPANTQLTPENTSANGYVPHPPANTQSTPVANSSACGYVPHSPANTQTTPVKSSGSGYVPYPPTNAQTTPVTNTSINGYVPNPPANTQTTPVSSSTKGYAPHPPATAQPTPVANSIANGYASHAPANSQPIPINSSLNGYVPHSVANTQPTHVTKTSVNDYVPHPPANTQTTPVNSSANGYVPHPPANTQPTPVNSSADGYLPNPPANT